MRLLTAVMGIVWATIAGRLIHLQLRQHHTFSEHALAQQTYEELIPARFGDIVDRQGRLLATTSTCRSLFVDPNRLTDPRLFAATVADILDLDTDRLIAKIEQNQSRQFLWLKRRLADDVADEVLGLELPESGWGLREELRRVYPQGELAAHVLGWRNIDGVPQAGLEKSLNESLQGVDGKRTLVRDARGYVIEVLEEVAQPPRHGGTVMLTIDADIQRAAEDRLDDLMAAWRPRSASVVVINPQVGEVLAMAARPTFDPGRPSASPTEAWTNPIISSALEPGSTIKPCLVAWAIDQQFLSRRDTFSCNGTYQMGRRLLHDHRRHGMLDVSGVIVRSSNIGMAQIGERLGNERLSAAVRAFGFGRKTGIELPGESSGIVRPLDQWDHYSTGSVTMGQELSTTPLQMITAHAALANGGTLVTPHLVLRLTDEGRQPRDVLATKILGEETARWMRTGPLVEVVRHGTGKRAAIDGVTVFAKTGTAQKYDREAHAYSETRYVASCLCGAPAESPRVLVLVTVDEPTTTDDPYGGTVAGPAASDILKSALQILDASPSSERLLRMAAEDFRQSPGVVGPSRH